MLFRSVFTPQVVVNGGVHLVGSDRAAVARAVAEQAVLPVPVDLETRGDALVVSIGDAGDAIPTSGATVWIVRYDVLRTITVARGENKGRSLAYAHLVRSLQPIGMWKGMPLRIELPRQEIVQDDDVGCAVLVQTEQDGAPGPIVGARVLQAPPRS